MRDLNAENLNLHHKNMQHTYASDLEGTVHVEYNEAKFET